MTNNDDANKTKPFPSGPDTQHPGALKALEEAEIQPLELLNRQVVGDWGDLVDEDKELNNQAVGEGTRILSVYVLDTGAKVWIITEGDQERHDPLTPRGILTPLPDGPTHHRTSPTVPIMSETTLPVNFM